MHDRAMHDNDDRKGTDMHDQGVSHDDNPTHDHPPTQTDGSGDPSNADAPCTHQNTQNPLTAPSFYETTTNVMLNALTDYVSRKGGPVVVYGKPGMGKATGATHAVANSSVPWVGVTLNGGSTGKQALETLSLATLRTTPSGRGYDLRQELAEHLAANRRGLFVDEAHYAGVPGLHAIRGVSDAVEAMTGAPLTMLLVGSDLDHYLNRAPELKDRVKGWVKFTNLTDEDDVLGCARTLSPRLAATPDSALLLLNDRIALGSMRQWAFIAEAADELCTGTGPLTKAEIALIIAKSNAPARKSKPKPKPKPKPKSKP